jgi:hypothetical protein
MGARFAVNVAMKQPRCRNRRSGSRWPFGGWTGIGGLPRTELNREAIEIGVAALLVRLIGAFIVARRAWG